MAASQGGPSDLKERSVGELLKELSTETSTLVRKEMELARAELQQQGKRAGKGAGLLGGAGVTALLALGSLTATVIALLDTAMETWLAALIVTVIWGATSCRTRRRRRRRPLRP
jgi:uncharacterized membrane protein YqjE